MTLTIDSKNGLDSNLQRVTYRLWEVQQQQKKLEDEKKKLREQFFALANDHIVANRKLGQKQVECPDGANPHTWSEQEFPGWNVLRVDTSSVGGDQRVLVTLEENPSYLKFTFVNPQLKMVFSRQIATVGQSFLVEEFMKQWPEFARWCVDTKTVYSLNEDAAQDMIQDDPELIPVFQEYTTPGKPQIKLAAPRKATADDFS